MSLSSALSKVFDLPWNKAFIEAENKLVQTYCAVNGTLVFVTKVGQEYLEVLDYKGDTISLPSVAIQTVEFWMPRSGIYIPKDKNKSPVVLYKKPIRQWKRSFYNDLYEWILLKNDRQIKPLSIFDVYEAKRKEFYVDCHGDIFYYEHKIGRIESSTKISCLDSFSQEIKDWVNHDI